MTRLLLVGTGGFIGSMLRYLVSGWTQKQVGSSFPWGTFAVNALGCFLIGYIMTFAVEIAPVSTEARLFLVTGVLGGLTTFSTFSYESLSLFHDGQIWIGLLNIGLNVAIGLLAVGLGTLTARSL